MTEITEALAIELTKNHLKNGQDEKPKDWDALPMGGVSIMLSDNRRLFFNRVEVEHARIQLNRSEK
jgi:hypothetical protein